ncbi:hypothetical protein [Thiomicrorhabdus xiamenensis]|uniref:Uncharacterized protein n=1 Tax=Thiomicrorhabdus xiamenensis TaxID=2739063 RepID=A0A7D4SZC9_9GAMM|nr:hypothetical protein [Thiomicrorhabdus xiamenensis]QKI89804.1 hypothetical protein HQN79_09585 [Thiomicrorhabdus xiamenensis]
MFQAAYSLVRRSAKLWSAGLIFIISAALLHGCSTPQTQPEPDRPSKHYALVVNLADSFNKLYPKVYLNDQYIFRDKLLLVPKTYQFKVSYRDHSGRKRSQVMRVELQANRCYHLDYSAGQFRFTSGAYGEAYCSAMIDRTRYELTSFSNAF